MEEKLLELIKTARECGKVSKKYYVEVHYLGEDGIKEDTIRVEVRSKKNYIFVNTMQITFNEGIFTIDDIIQKLEKVMREDKTKCLKEKK